MATPEMSAPAVTTMYAALGGTDAVRRLVNRFYDLMDGEPSFAQLRALHAPDLAPMRDKLTDWMCAWLGGPQHYYQRPDAVCIGAAHGSYAIDAVLRDQWLECMHRALAESGAAPAVQTRIRAPLAELANFLRNR
jgi:hemoglobin